MSRGTEYPKFVYHQIKGQKIVKTAEEQKSLGGEWVETPFPKKEEIGLVSGAEGLTDRVERLEAMFDKLKTRKDIEKLFNEA